MGKVRQIFVWNGACDLGPFRRAELVEQLGLGTVLPSYYYWEEGMNDWERVAILPCCAPFLASEAQKQMLNAMGVIYDEFLTKRDVSTFLEQQPATERQLALLEYLGIQASPQLTKYQASEAIDAAKNDPLLGERFDRWNVDRLELHPDMYAVERNAFKQSRAEILLRQHRDFRSDMRENGVDLRPLTMTGISGLISELDRRRPGWDSQIELTGLDHVLDLLEKKT